MYVLGIILPSHYVLYTSQIMDTWHEELENVPLTNETSHRLAVCNMDWDSIDAKDIFGNILYCVTSSLTFSIYLLPPDLLFSTFELVQNLLAPPFTMSPSFPATLERRDWLVRK